MSMFDNLKDKASQMAKDALADEGTSDSALDKARDAADQATGGRFTDQINQARDAADGQVGDDRTHSQDPAEGTDPAAPSEPTQPEEHSQAPAEG